MAVTETADKVTVNVQLNNGVDEDGNVKTVNSSLGAKLSTTGFDGAKVFGIITSMNAVLDKSVYSVQKVLTSTMTNS